MSVNLHTFHILSAAGAHNQTEREANMKSDVESVPKSQLTVAQKVRS